MSKKAIVLVSFGTSIKRAEETGIKPIEDRVIGHFKDYKVVRAFTSNIIIKKLKERDGIEIDRPLEAIEKLYNDGYRNIIVQPTHIIPGFEYDKVMASVVKARHIFKNADIKLGKPLLYFEQDYAKVVEIFKGKMETLEDTGLVLMGHGTEHFANAAYFRLSYYLKKANKNIFIANVEGDPDFEEVVSQVKDQGLKKVILRPLMIVAGDHAINDMSSDDEDSLASMLKNEGIDCEFEIEGLGSIEVVQDIFISNIEKTINLEG